MISKQIGIGLSGSIVVGKGENAGNAVIKEQEVYEVE